MNANGGAVKQLTSLKRRAGWPTWSPDGSKMVANEIAAERVDIAGIFVLDATTGVQVAYIPNPDHDMDATWTKDGKQIVFDGQRGNNGGLDLFVTTPVRGAVTALPPVIRLTSFIGNEVSPAYSR